MGKRILNLILAALFILFAYWQVNDPDPWLWIPIYGGLATLLILGAFGRYFYLFSLVCLMATVGGLIYYIPDFIQWMQDGMPTITGAMKAESPYVEWVREFLGLFIAGLGWLLLFFQARKARS